jgi:hypothetical protein
MRTAFAILLALTGCAHAQPTSCDLQPSGTDWRSGREFASECHECVDTYQMFWVTTPTVPEVPGAAGCYLNYSCAKREAKNACIYYCEKYGAGPFGGSPHYLIGDDSYATYNKHIRWCSRECRKFDHVVRPRIKQLRNATNYTGDEHSGGFCAYP